MFGPLRDEIVYLHKTSPSCGHDAYVVFYHNRQPFVPNCIHPPAAPSLANIS